MKDCKGGDDFDWLSQQAQQVQVLQQRQQLQQQLNKILSKDEKLEQLRKGKEKVAIICMKIVIRHVGLCTYTKHGPEYFIVMQVTGTLYIHVIVHHNTFLFNNQPNTLIIQIYSVIKLYMFWASSLPIIRSSLLYIRHW